MVTRNHPRRARRLRRIAGAVGGVFAVLVLLALGFSQTAMFRRWLGREVVSRLNATLAGRVALGRLDGNLFGGLVMTDIRVTLEGRRVLAARRVVARYNLLELATGGDLRLTDATIDGLALTALEDERGWNLARLYVSEEEAPPETRRRRVTLEHVALRDAGLKMIRPTALLKLRDLTLAGSADFADESRVALETFTVSLPGRGLRVEELTGKVAIAADGAVSADDVHLRTAASELRAHARVPGKAAGDYDLAADIIRLSAEEVRRVLGVAAPQTDVAGRLRAKGPPSAVAIEAALESAEGTVGLGGTADLAAAPPRYDVLLTLGHLNAGAILGPPRPVTDVNGTVKVTGAGTTLDDLATAIVIALRDSTVDGRTFESLDVDGKVADREITLRAAARSGPGAAEVAGSLALATERYHLRLTTQEFDPMPFVSRPDLSARLNATLVASGTGFEPRTARSEVLLTLAPSRVHTIRIREGSAALRADAGQLAIERLTLSSNVADARASGTLAIAAQAGGPAPEVRAGAPAATHAGAGGPATVDAGATSDMRGAVDFEVRAVDLGPLAELAGAAPLGGSAQVSGKASGSLRALDVRAHLEAKDLTRGETRVGTLSGDVEAKDLGAVRAGATLRAHAETLTAGNRRFAALDLDGTWEQVARATSRATFTLRAGEDDQHRHELAGRATLGPQHNRVEFETIRLDLGDDTWTAEGQPVIVQQGERVTIEQLALRSPRGRVVVAGSAATRGNENLTLDVEGLDLAVLEKSMDERVSGRLSLHAHLGGTATAPRVDGTMHVDAPTLGGVRYESLRGDVAVGDGRMTVAARVVQEGTRSLVLDAAVPLEFSLAPVRFAPGDSLRGTLGAQQIDLAFADPLVPQVSRLGGTLDAQLALGGSLRVPEVEGTLAVTSGRAYVVPLGVTYDPVELEVRIAGRTLDIARLRIASGKGTLTGGGNARLDNGRALMDARFELAAFPLFANRYGNGAASGWVWMSGDTTAPVVEGSLQTEGFVLRIPEHLPGAVRPPDPTISVVRDGTPDAAAGPSSASGDAPVAGGGADSRAHLEEEKAPAPSPGIYERAAITIQVDIPKDAWIRRSDANIELRGWMTAWKQPGDELRLAGDINAVRGWYAFQGKKFTLEEGQVTFTGQDFDPLLRLVAVHTAGDYTVRVVVGGTITKPSLELESDPTLEQADILAVLLFGKPARDLNQGESQGLREQAVGLAGNYVASELRQSVADALGLDNLEFDTGKQGLSDAKVSFGKYIAEDIFVSLSHRFGKQNVEEVRIEYSITPQWSVETSSDTLGDSGVDVFWKRRY